MALVRYQQTFYKSPLLTKGPKGSLMLSGAAAQTLSPAVRYICLGVTTGRWARSRTPSSLRLFGWLIPPLPFLGRGVEFGLAVRSIFP